MKNRRHTESSTPPREWDALRLLVTLVAVALAAYHLASVGKAGARQAAAPRPMTTEDPVFVRGAVAPGWQDWSWATHAIPSRRNPHNGSASMELTPEGYKGLYLHHAGRSTSGYSALWLFVHGGVVGGQKVSVCVANREGKFQPGVEIGALLPGGRIPAGVWSLVIVPLARLKAARTVITGIVFQDASGKPQAPVYFADVKLAGRDAIPAAPYRIQMDTSRARRPISPFIYGMDAAGGAYFAELRIGSNRWGGNQTSRYNWELGNAFSNARDWEFRNTNFGATNPKSRQPSGAADEFIRWNREARVATVLTIPAIGFVARDDSAETRSIGVPPQGGVPVAPGSPAIEGYDPAQNRLRTSIPSYPRKRAPFKFPPDKTDNAVYQDEWVYHLVQTFGAAAQGGVRFYAIDNEPDLWSSTHTDIRPAALSYDDLLSTFLEYASAIKGVDPTAQVTGPVSWGWTGYIHSPRDAARRDFNGRPDRRAHGDMEFIPWFLASVRKHDSQTGKRTLDVLDIHYYPQAQGVFSSRSDPATQALRIRSARSLWDPAYSDESWIGQPVRLIPRMQEWINKRYPGTRLGITEWNWGADTTMGGGIAIAEVLGIFGREGVYLANYWMKPPEGSPGYLAFKMYRNADGKGAALGDTSVSAQSGAPDDISSFGGLDSASGRAALMVINKQADRACSVAISLRHAKPVSSAEGWRLASGRITRIPELKVKGGHTRIVVPAWSVTLLRFK